MSAKPLTHIVIVRRGVCVCVCVFVCRFCQWLSTALRGLHRVEVASIAAATGKETGERKLARRHHILDIDAQKAVGGRMVCGGTRRQSPRACLRRGRRDAGQLREGKRVAELSRLVQCGGCGERCLQVRRVQHVHRERVVQRRQPRSRVQPAHVHVLRDVLQKQLLLRCQLHLVLPVRRLHERCLLLRRRRRGLTPARLLQPLLLVLTLPDAAALLLRQLDLRDALALTLLRLRSLRRRRRRRCRRRGRLARGCRRLLVGKGLQHLLPGGDRGLVFGDRLVCGQRRLEVLDGHGLGLPRLLGGDGLLEVRDVLQQRGTEGRRALVRASARLGAVGLRVGVQVVCLLQLVVVVAEVRRQCLGVALLVIVRLALPLLLLPLPVLRQLRRAPGLLLPLGRPPQDLLREERHGGRDLLGRAGAAAAVHARDHDVLARAEAEVGGERHTLQEHAEVGDLARRVEREGVARGRCHCRVGVVRDEHQHGVRLVHRGRLHLAVRVLQHNRVALAQGGGAQVVVPKEVRRDDAGHRDVLQLVRLALDRSDALGVNPARLRVAVVVDHLHLPELAFAARFVPAVGGALLRRQRVLPRARARRGHMLGQADRRGRRRRLDGLLRRRLVQQRVVGAAARPRVAAAAAAAAVLRLGLGWSEVAVQRLECGGGGGQAASVGQEAGGALHTCGCAALASLHGCYCRVQ
eukprot:Rhum_TRINITY_DN15109_c15_g1::Rhum_TRINITY_DN15109_c15_g1_i1::g.140346::m.140346